MYLETPSQVTLAEIPSGKAGVLATLKAMSRMVRDGKKSYAVIQAATARTRHCDNKDLACRIHALHAYVRDSIRYQLDPVDVELLQTPDKTIERGAGDCDDQAILLAALLESLGIPSRFVAIGFAPGVFEHVYTEAKIGSGWIPLETTERVEAGWNPADNAAVQARLVHYN